MKKAWTLQDDDCGDARMDIAVVVEETEEDALEALRKELQDGGEYCAFVVIDDSIYQFTQGYGYNGGYKGEKWDRKDLRPEMWDIGASCGRYNLIEVLCCYKGKTYDDVEEFFKCHDLIKPMNRKDFRRKFSRKPDFKFFALMDESRDIAAYLSNGVVLLYKEFNVDKEGNVGFCCANGKNYYPVDYVPISYDYDEDDEDDDESCQHETIGYIEE